MAGKETAVKEYDLPSDLIAGRDTITVKFAGHEGNYAGGVFGCATLRAR